jgi:septum formation protein
MTWKGSYILAADTVVAVGRRILGKAEFADEASASLHLLSGRSHWVYTGVCLVTPDRKVRQKIVETKVRFKRLVRFRESRTIWPRASGAERLVPTASRGWLALSCRK